MLFDVTDGCNPGGCPNDGFCAAPGWDPASGNFFHLSTILKQFKVLELHCWTRWFNLHSVFHKCLINGLNTTELLTKNEQ